MLLMCNIEPEHDVVTAMLFTLVGKRNDLLLDSERAAAIAGVGVRGRLVLTAHRS